MVAPKRKILAASVLGAVVIGGLGISSAQATPADGKFLIFASNDENPEITGQAGYSPANSGGEVTPPEELNNIEAPQAALVLDLEIASTISWSGDPGNRCEVVGGYCVSGPGWDSYRSNAVLYGIPQQWVDGVQNGSYSVELKSGAELTDGNWLYIIQEDGTPLTKSEFAAIFPGTNYAEIEAELNRRVNAEWSAVTEYITPDKPLQMASESWKFKYDSTAKGLSIKPPHNVLETRFVEAVEAQTDRYIYSGWTTNGGDTVTVPSELIVTDLESRERKTFPISIQLQLPS